MLFRLIACLIVVILTSALGEFIPIEECSGDLNSCIVDCHSWGKLDLRRALNKKQFTNYDFAAENGVILYNNACGSLPDHFVDLLSDEGDNDILKWYIGVVDGEFTLRVVFPNSLEARDFDPTALETTYHLTCKPEIVGSTIVDAQGEGLSVTLNIASQAVCNAFGTAIQAGLASFNARM